MDNSIKTVLKVVLFYISLFLLTLAFCVRSDVLDYDLWSRLIQGFGVIHNKSVYYNDIISYTPTHIWYDPEWLSSAFIYLVCKKFEGAGLVFLKTILVYLFLVSLSFGIKNSIEIKDRIYSLCYYIFILLLIGNASVTSNTVRCQLFTFVIFSIWILLLEKARNGNHKILILLPFIMLFWLNVHGGCIAGVGLLVLYIIGEFFNKKPIKPFIIALLFVIVVFPINPWGVDYIKFLFDSIFIDRVWIAEWQSSLHKFNNIYFLSLLTAIFCYFFKIYKQKIKFNNIDKTKAIVLAVLIYLSAKHIKHIGLYASGISIFLYGDFIYCYDYLLYKLKSYLKIQNSGVPILIAVKNTLLYLTVFIYFGVNIFFHPISTSYYALTMNSFPVKPVEFLLKNNIKGNVFAPFYISSFIAYKCYPNIKIYMDGRQEQVYNYDLFDREMFFMITAGKNYKNILDNYNHDIVLLDKKSMISKKMQEFQKWNKIYDDEKYVMYSKNTFLKFKYDTIDKANDKLLDTIFDSYFKDGK